MDTKQPMTLEDYKRTVKKHLLEKCNCSIEETERLMNLYDDDFPEFFEWNWGPGTVEMAMVMGY